MKIDLLWRQAKWGVPVAAVLALLLAGPAIASQAGATPDTSPPPPGLVSAYADTNGAVLIDASGQAFLDWDSTDGAKADYVWTCKIQKAGTCTSKIRLPLPASSSTYGISQPFPVFGGVSGVVYAVGPSYVYGYTIIWKSTNWGGTYGAGVAQPVGSYYGGTTVGDVLYDPGSPKSVDYMDVASSGSADADYSLTGPEIVKQCEECSFSFGAGGVVGSTLGDSGVEQVEAYWTDAKVPTVDYYWSKDGGGVPGAWSSHPVQVSDGIDARLVGGPHGLFLLSEDYTSPSEESPSKLDVRKWNPTTHEFGAPVTVVNDPASVESTDQGGFAEDTATGALYVAWPGTVSSEGGAVMRVWYSNAADTSFTGPKYVSTVPCCYAGPTRMAVRNGDGFLTFLAGGLRLVDLSNL